MKRFTVCMTVTMLLGLSVAVAQVEDPELTAENSIELARVDTFIYDYQSLQERAMYIGGDDSLNRFILSQLQLQKSLNFSAKMSFSVVVNQDSTLEDIKLVTTTRNLEPYAKSAVIQSLIFTSGQWIPGIKNGVAVRSRRIVDVEIRW